MSAGKSGHSGQQTRVGEQGEEGRGEGSVNELKSGDGDDVPSG